MPKKSLPVFILLLYIALINSDSNPPQKENVKEDETVAKTDKGHRRQSKQFWSYLPHTRNVGNFLPKMDYVATQPLSVIHQPFRTYRPAYQFLPLSSFPSNARKPSPVPETAINNNNKKKEKDSDQGLEFASHRAANTLTAFQFSENSTPEEELAIVENVNQLLSEAVLKKTAEDKNEGDGIESSQEEEEEGKQGEEEFITGRQAVLNGGDIFSADDGIIQPGRPNLEPIESLSHGGHHSNHHHHHGPFEVGGGIRGGYDSKRHQDCCLFIFFDGSAHYFDDYLRMLTGYYRLMYGTVNGHPHYVARGCKEADQYGPNCSYIWHSGYGWIVGIGTYIGQTKGVIYTRSHGACPSDYGSSRWRYLNSDMEWRDNGNIYIECAS